MPRFSLSNDEDDDNDDEAYGDLQDGYDEEEPAHPLGFDVSQWGRTWIGLDPPSSFLASPGRSTYTLDDYGDDEYAFLTTPQRQAYPPLSSYISAASTPALLKYRAPIADEEKQELDNLMEDDEVILLQRMLQRQSLTAKLPPPTPTKSLPPFHETTRHIQQKLLLERQRMEQEHAATTKAVKNVCLELEREADAILKTRQLEEETAKRKEQEQETREKQKQEQKLELQEKERKHREGKQAEQDEKRRQEEQKRVARNAKQAEKTEYVEKAKKLVTQLVAVRESIEPFDKNQAVSKRRLAMKKTVRGKTNTLSENAAKIQAVATDVSRAITEAREEDEQIKQALERKEPGLTSDMARGKRYLVDLVASNAIQRVQAEGFNGPRGDGFPLASMLAMISLENKELVPIFAAHIYTVCPTAIPTLPTPAPGASEEELMSSLGMLKDKNGEYETFDRFLSRTENIVALVANVMSSSPSSHVLLGGNRGAVDWLTRFLDLLPPPPTAPLPLVTAPVLHGFLTEAGHMLANKHPDTFIKHVKLITEEVLSRLDEGPIGKPSSIRLAKLMEGGFDKFRTTLPERALPELYYGAGSSQEHVGIGVGGGTTFSSASSAQGGFGSKKPSAIPFGSSAGPSLASSNPFGGIPHTTSSLGGGGSNAFGAPSSATGGFASSRSEPTSGGFSGMSTDSTSQSAPFGAAGGFGAPSSGDSNPFGASMNASNNAGGTPFGSTGPTKSPFGGAPSAFGGGSNAATMAQSPFGSGQSPNPSPFGASSTSTPFGRGSGGGGFGGSSNGTAGGPSPFGGGQPSNPPPFGGGGGGFGGANTNSSASFGEGGGGRGSRGKQPCHFFAQGRCKFGDSCKFSHEAGGGGGGGGGSFAANSRGSGDFNNSGRGGGGFGSSGGVFAKSGGGGRGFGVGNSPFSGGAVGGGASNPFGAARR